MTALTQLQGRYLGGRPPYGYRLVPAGPHPNPTHARWGRKLLALAPDLTTAPIVQWMSTQRQAGTSYARPARFRRVLVLSSTRVGARGARSRSGRQAKFRPSLESPGRRVRGLMPRPLGGVADGATPTATPRTTEPAATSESHQNPPVPFGVPSPVGPSQPTRAVHSWLGEQVPLEPEVTSKNDVEWVYG